MYALFRLANVYPVRVVLCCFLVYTFSSSWCVCITLTTPQNPFLLCSRLLFGYALARESLRRVNLTSRLRCRPFFNSLKNKLKCYSHACHKWRTEMWWCAVPIPSFGLIRYLSFNSYFLIQCPHQMYMSVHAPGHRAVPYLDVAFTFLRGLKSVTVCGSF